MVIEAALIKPVVDALMGLFKQGESLRLKHNAETALREAIRELLLANPDDNRAEARIAIARAAGILSEDIVLAENMLKTHRATKARTRGKAATGRKRQPAVDPAAKDDASADAGKPTDGKPSPAVKGGKDKAVTQGKGAGAKPAARKPAARSPAKPSSAD